MTKRRRLPAPPLILQPHLIRLPEVSGRLPELVALAKFLEARRLLTDGGVKNLSEGFVGRNEQRTLSGQDVRSWAQALVLELWDCEAPTEWEGVAERYFARYDRGKPRRPTHLQRLYLEWSRDFSWPGLLRAASHHPNLWTDLGWALERLDDDHPERPILELALAAKDNVGAWHSGWSMATVSRRELLRLLPLLPSFTIPERVRTLSGLVSEIDPSSLLARVGISASLLSYSQSRDLDMDRSELLVLEDFANRSLEYFPLPVEPSCIAAFRTFVTRRSTLELLLDQLDERDPIRRVSFGPRPGVLWLDAFVREMNALIELRSS